MDRDTDKRQCSRLHRLEFFHFKQHCFPPIKPVKPPFKTFAVVASLIAILLGASANARVLDNSVGAGTVISTRAEATYQDEAGESFSTVSPTITITVSAVATLAVTPDETVPSDTVVTPVTMPTRSRRRALK